MSSIDDLERGWYRLFQPPATPTLSEWSEENFRLSTEYSSKTGRLTLREWQKPILDTFTDPYVFQTSVSCGTQLIKTLFIQCATAFIISKGLGPTLIGQPADADALAFSKERVTPMARDIPAIRGKLAEEKTRSTSNTILHKDFPGGSLSITGTISPGNTARRTIRNFFADEVDLWTWSAGGKGHPFLMGLERVVTFGTRGKVICVCSPTIKDRSLIQKQIERSDGRQPWVPCPNCGVHQQLVWKQIKWDTGVPLDYQAETAYYECPKCHAQWDDIERWKAIEKTEYRALRRFRGHAGFSDIWHIFSPYKRHSHMVQQWLDQHADPELLQVFVNTTLAQLWEVRGDAPKWRELQSASEDYPFGAEPGRKNTEAVVPMGALMLTAAVDVQESPPRLEYEVFGHGRNREKWSIAYGVIQIPDGKEGWLPVTDPELWDVELEKVLMFEWKHATGGVLPIWAMAIDTGRRPEPVYRFASRHQQPIYGRSGAQVPLRSVIPIKGNGREQLRVIASITGEDAARKRGGVRIVSLGVNVIKPAFFDRLRLPPPGPGQPVPHGYRHHPKYSDAYFQGLCAEERQENGTYKTVGRNEPVDCGVYDEGLVELLGINRFTDAHWTALEMELGIDSKKAAPPVVVVNPATSAAHPANNPPPAPAGRTRRNDWFAGRKKNWFN